MKVIYNGIKHTKLPVGPLNGELSNNQTLDHTKEQLPLTAVLSPPAFTLPRLPSCRLQLVDPGFVNIHRIGVDAKTLVFNDVFDHRSQQLSECVVASCTSVEAHHHLDNCWVPCHDVLDLVYLGPDTHGEQGTVDQYCLPYQDRGFSAHVMSE